MIQLLKPIAFAALLVLALSAPVAAQSGPPDSAQVALETSDVSLGGRLTYSGRGFDAGEQTSVTVEDDQGTVQADLEPVHVEADGQVYMVSVPVPGGLTPGAHVLRVAGVTSGHVGRATFTLRWQTPTVHLASYTGKATHALSLAGSGFVPGEPVDMFLGDQMLSPVATLSADGRGDIISDNVAIPRLDAGDYQLTFMGRASQTPVSIGYNVQAFHPWVVLTNYYLQTQGAVGFNGEDFVPGEAIQVYLNGRTSAPIAQVTADGDGRFSVEQALSVADLKGDNQLIFVGQQSQAELTATFSVAAQ